MKSNNKKIFGVFKIKTKYFYSKILKTYSNIFKYYAVDWPPHSLIRKYCVDIALSIEQQFPSTYIIEDLEQIKQKIISKFPKQIITREERYSKKRVKTKIKRDNSTEQFCSLSGVEMNRIVLIYHKIEIKLRKNNITS